MDPFAFPNPLPSDADSILELYEAALEAKAFTRGNVALTHFAGLVLHARGRAQKRQSGLLIAMLRNRQRPASEFRRQAEAFFPEAESADVAASLVKPFPGGAFQRDKLDDLPIDLASTLLGVVKGTPEHFEAQNAAARIRIAAHTPLVEVASCQTPGSHEAETTLRRVHDAAEAGDPPVFEKPDVAAKRVERTISRALQHARLTIQAIQFDRIPPQIPIDYTPIEVRLIRVALWRYAQRSGAVLPEIPQELATVLPSGDSEW